MCGMLLRLRVLHPQLPHRRRHLYLLFDHRCCHRRLNSLMSLRRRRLQLMPQILSQIKLFQVLSGVGTAAAVSVPPDQILGSPTHSFFRYRSQRLPPSSTPAIPRSPLAIGLIHSHLYENGCWIDFLVDDRPTVRAAGSSVLDCISAYVASKTASIFVRRGSLYSLTAAHRVSTNPF